MMRSLSTEEVKMEVSELSGNVVGNSVIEFLEDLTEVRMKALMCILDDSN